MKKSIIYSLMFWMAMTASLISQTMPSFDTQNNQIQTSDLSQLSADALISPSNQTSEGQLLHGLPSVQDLKEIQCTIVPIPKSDPRYKNHVSSRPRIPVTQGISLNWSGYAVATNLQNPAPGSVTAVIGIWAVPALSPSSQATYSSAWVGIDGYASPTVEQIGTEHDWLNGAQSNYAWFEMYPNGAFLVSGFPVFANDLVSGLVQYLGNGVFQLSIYNYTRGVFTAIPTNFTTNANAQRSSAEWIVEAPSSTQGVLPLAHFGFVPFVNCKALINGVVDSISSPFWMNDPIFMRAADGTFKAGPSALSPDGTSFYVQWFHE